MINKFLIVYSVLLTLAVGFLFFKVYENPKTGTTNVQKGNNTIPNTSAFAYVNIDTLTEKYVYAKQYSEGVYAKKNTIEKKYEMLAKAWERKAIQFEEKGRMGTLSAQEIQNTQQNLGLEQEKIVKDREKELSTLMEEDRVNNKKFSDDISSFIKEYNKDGKYKFIFSYIKNGNMLYADETADITNDIVNGLNEKFAKTNK